MISPFGTCSLLSPSPPAPGPEPECTWSCTCSCSCTWCAPSRMRSLWTASNCCAALLILGAMNSNSVCSVCADAMDSKAVSWLPPPEKPGSVCACGMDSKAVCSVCGCGMDSKAVCSVCARAMDSAKAARSLTDSRCHGLCAGVCSVCAVCSCCSPSDHHELASVQP